MADENIGQDLMNIPLGDMVRSIAMAIADAQFQLDKSSIIMAEFMSGERVLRDINTGEIVDANGRPTQTPVTLDSRVYFGYTINDGKREAQRLSMLELGFVPNFYQFVDTMIEIKLALRINKSKGPGGGTTLTSTPVDATYASAYNYSAEFAAVFKTKLVPVPPPSALEERLRGLLAQQQPTTPAQSTTPPPTFSTSTTPSGTPSL